MALRQSGLIYSALAASTLTIPTLSGESMRIRKVYVTNVSAALANATFVTGGARVGFFRVKGRGGAHLLAPNDPARGVNLLDFMHQNAGFPGYPVDEGFSFTVNIDTGTADIYVIADSFDSGDIKPDQPYGRSASDYTYVAYGTNLAAITASGYNKVDNNLNPSEFNRFPFAPVGQGLVPAGFRASVLMIGGQAVGRFASAGNTGNTTALRPRKGAAPSVTLLDRNDVGYPFIGTVPGGAGSDYTSGRQMLPSSSDTGGFNLLDDEEMLITPQLDFVGNEEFGLQVQTTIVGTGTLAIGDIDVWVLVRIFKG
jgi:hypothetical protein